MTKAIDSIADIVSGLDPEFFPESQLTALNNHLRHTHFWNQLSNYSSNHQIQHLKTANDHLTPQIPTIYQMGALAKKPESRKAIRDAEEAYEAFCKAIEKKEGEFTEIADKKATEISELETRSDELDTALTAMKSTTETQIATWQKEFTKAQTERIEQHSEAQRTRTKEYETALNKFKTDSESDRTETTKKHDLSFRNVLESYVADVKAKSGEMNTKHQEILTLHGLVTTDGVAGGYKKGADEERSAATIWSGISMVCYGLILLWALSKGKLGFGIASATGIDWPVVVTTISVTAVAFVAAQFAGKQSRIHRINE